MPSAIVLPEPSPERASSPNLMKRRRSTDLSVKEEGDSKRQRVNGNGNGTATASPAPAEPNNDEARTNGDKDEPALPINAQTSEEATNNGAPESKPASKPARKVNVADEKQRSKRLFGALLGSLNPKDSETSRRRQEIEARKKADLKRQDEQRAEDEVRRKEQALEWRRRRQGRVEEDEMRIRHKSMLDRANFLVTQAEPRVHYRPWDLRAAEEDRIDEQIKETQALINREVEEFEARQPRKQTLDGADGTITPMIAFEPRGCRTNFEAAQATVRPTTDSATAADMTETTVKNPKPEAHVKADDVAEDSAKSASSTTNDENGIDGAEDKPAEVPDSPDLTDPTSNNAAKPYVADERDTKDDDREEEQILDGDEETVIY